MAIHERIYKLRTAANLSQEQFAALFGISRQSVQKWEAGTSQPELDKLVKIAKHFDISLDAIVLDSDSRMMEELSYHKTYKPKYANVNEAVFYGSNLMTEYRQCMEEGLDISNFKSVFESVSRLPKDEIKKKLADTLFETVCNAKPVANFPYTEPSTLEEIRQLRQMGEALPAVDTNKLPNQIHGAWLGRVCGCMLGRTVECIRTDELIPFLTESGNYPMHRYISRKDISEYVINKYTYRFASRDYADDGKGMPSDDDTNYTVMSQLMIDKYGRDFTPYDVSRAWLYFQRKDAYCTAEHVAYCNFVKGYEPPESAVYKNPFREWIGAQIRTDYYGYINPGNPELAAEMAFRDASISHVKNGIYGAMWVSAMLAAAAATRSMETIIRSGLAQIPHTSRLHEAITQVLDWYNSGVSSKKCFANIHARFDEFVEHDWCHTISNAMIVAASLLYGHGDYGKSICLAVQTGFDTDCNGATVGSVVGMAYGTAAIGKEWSDPIRDTLNTSIFGVGTVKISDMAAKTMAHVKV